MPQHTATRLYPLVLALSLLPVGCTWIPTLVNQSVDAATTLAEHRSLYQTAEDYAIRQEITSKLLDANLLLDVCTDVYNGRVMLTGAVKTRAAQKRAEVLAREVPTVRAVINEIQIAEISDMGSAAAGLFIEAKLKVKFLTADNIRSLNYRWRATNGVVYLLGASASPQELASVMSIAKDTDGVREVVSHVVSQNESEEVIPERAGKKTSPSRKISQKRKPGVVRAD